MSYLRPYGYGEAELVEKRSRFIGQVWPVETEDEARGLLDRVRAQYHDARHHCWCYILRDGGAVRYSDDGEPQGTAGQPMLEVFRRGGVENVLCVVTRYFGGILLGTGGLTRAYSGTAKLALDAAGLSEMRSRVCLALTVPYHLFERVKNEIERCGGMIDTVDYAENVTVAAHFSADQEEPFRARLTELSSGAVQCEKTGEKFMAVPVGGKN